MIQIDTFLSRSFLRFAAGLTLLFLLSTGVQAADTTPPPSQFVIVISVDGLGGTYLNKLFNGTATGGPYAIPNFTRLKNEGAGTLAAHCDNDNWETLPNHTSIITARPRDGVAGHNWTTNSDPAAGQTIHSIKGSYVASVFDVAHDNGLRTGLYANKSKFMLFDTYGTYTNGGSYNAANGAPDTTGADNGRDKIDSVYLNTALGGIVVDTYITQQKSANPNQYAFLHINEPDSYGHSTGWGSATWNSQVVVVDTMLGKLFKLIEQDVPAMIGTTTIILTADHGNQYNPPTGADRYSVPVFVWGPGVPAGADLYTLNSGRRQAASSYPMTTYGGLQPIRNAEVNNLALQLLGLGPIPGSSFNVAQDLLVAAPPSVTTATATSVAPRRATLNGSALPMYAETTGWFRYSTTNPGACSDSFGMRLPASSANDSTLGAGSAPVNYSQAVSGLLPGTTYFYCAVARNATGTAFGGIDSFTTLPTTALSLSISGPGTVTYHNQAGFTSSCGSLFCQPTVFDAGDTVTLSATGSRSSFSAWSGDISGVDNPATVLMDTDKNITAVFKPDPPTVRVNDSDTPYYSISSALQDMLADGVIRARDTDFSENIVHTNPHDITLRGGFSDQAFGDNSQSGYSTVSGSLEVQAGRLTVESVMIRP